MDPSIPEQQPEPWLDKPVVSFLPKIKIEHLIITIILILAVISRFYDLGVRSFDHDEVNHVIPSFDLYQGRGYVHSPVTHGPFQFHLIAASYFLFGDSDFTSRLPHALFSIVTIAFVMIAFKRYLGRTGALLAGVFFLIDPFMLFYGRYARNEAFVALFAVMLIWSVLYYLEKGKTSTLYLLAIVLALHFVTKEIAYIYVAILLIFLAILFMRDVMQIEWRNIRQRNGFLLGILLALGMIGIALGVSVIEARGMGENAAAAGGLATWASNNQAILHTGLLVSVGIAALFAILAMVLLLRGLAWKTVKHIRSFDLLMLTGTLVLPQLAAMVVSLLGRDPLDYTWPALLPTVIVLILLFVLSAAGGMVWRPKVWLVSTAIFYAIFTVLYTTFFTNGQGFFTGIVGGLGYWLSQQGVNRGTQPIYYYALIQLPMYEFMPVIGTIAAVIIATRKRLFSTLPGHAPANQPEPSQLAVQLPLAMESEPVQAVEELPRKLPVLAILVYWAVMNLLAYSVAGEKMPWLTVHIALPLLLASAWGIGYVIDRINWRQLLNRKGVLTLLLLPVFLTSLGAVMRLLLGANQPFAGTELAQLNITSTFMFAVVAALLSGWGILKLLADWETSKILTLFLVAVFGVLTLYTARSAYQANYINYDNGKEFLVYAHGAGGQTEVLKQVEEISQRTVGGNDIKVAYIGDALYPYWWYFRNYPNKTYIQSELTKELTTYPVVIGDDQYNDKTRAILKDQYVETTYQRLVWPMQDYFNLKFSQIWEAISNPQTRQALYNIWLNKDYTLYAELKNNPNLTVETWQPRADLHLYIRKDIVSQIWNYGTVPAAAAPVKVDPYAAKAITLTPDRFFGQMGNADGQLSGARGIALAKDGTIYVVDSGNNRIEHFTMDGKWLQSWGSFASVDQGSAPGGTFNQPFGIAIGPDGSVYVADTWNYRIQKFTADGQFVTMWGVSGQAETPDAFWGPRGLAVDAKGNVYVSDTGNKRVAVFDENGNFLTQFGTYGMESGQFDEPVGLAIDASGNVLVADTWNQRIQVFAPAADGSFTYLREWAVSGWTSQSVNNKPFLSLDSAGNVFTIDADTYRVLEFSSSGEFIRTWGDYSSGIDGFGVPSGIAVDDQGGVWVSDAENNYLLHFTLPASIQAQSSATPAFPKAAIELKLNALTGELENPFSQPVYRLDAALNEWAPVVPAEISAVVQSGATPEKIGSGEWVLNSADGNTLFNWNADLLLWVAASPASASATATQ